MSQLCLDAEVLRSRALARIFASVLFLGNPVCAAAPPVVALLHMIKNSARLGTTLGRAQRLILPQQKRRIQSVTRGT